MTHRQITVRLHHQDTVDWLDGDIQLASRYEDELARRLAVDLHATITIEDGYLIGQADCGVSYDSAVDDGVLQDAQDAYETICADLANDWSWAN